MSDQFLAEVRIFPFSFAPFGWALCQGQLMPLAQNTALFSLLGTTYGGNGVNTFALPDLQGATPIHAGQGPGLSDRELGESVGSTSVTLLPTELPSHNHAINARATAANNAAPDGAVPATGVWVQGASYGVVQAYATQAPDTPLSPTAISPQGGGLPHNNMMPYLTLNYAIALTGIFPSRP